MFLERAGRASKSFGRALNLSGTWKQLGAPRSQLEGPWSQLEKPLSQLEKLRSQLRGLGLDRMATDPAVTPLKLAGRAIEPAKRASDTVGRASEPAWMVPLHRSLSPTGPLPKRDCIRLLTCVGPKRNYSS